MRTLKRAAVTTAAIAIALTSALASPASAAPQPSPSDSSATTMAATNCPNSSMCGYVHSNFTTSGGYEINPVRTNGTCENVTFNDAWSSIRNGSGKTVRFFAQANCAGTTSSSFTLANGQESSSLGWSHPTFSDEISSYRWGG